MRATIVALGIAIAASPVQAAIACAPPPPGYVPPTERQLLERFVTSATDIVYGGIRRSGAQNEPSRFEILHIYRGSRKKGDMIDAVAGWDHPTPTARE